MHALPPPPRARSYAIACGGRLALSVDDTRLAGSEEEVKAAVARGYAAEGSTAGSSEGGGDGGSAAGGAASMDVDSAPAAAEQQGQGQQGGKKQKQEPGEPSTPLTRWAALRCTADGGVVPRTSRPVGQRVVGAGQAQYITAQRITAQRIAAHRSAAQHSTLPGLRCAAERESHAPPPPAHSHAPTHPPTHTQ